MRLAYFTGKDGNLYEVDIDQELNFDAAFDTDEGRCSFPLDEYGRIVSWEEYSSNRAKNPSRQIKAEVLLRDGMICRYCGKNVLDNYVFDHVYPFSKGGETSTQNIVVSCKECNQVKKAQIGIWPKPVGFFANGQFGGKLE